MRRVRLCVISSFSTRRLGVLQRRKRNEVPASASHAELTASFYSTPQWDLLGILYREHTLILIGNYTLSSGPISLKMQFPAAESHP